MYNISFPFAIYKKKEDEKVVLIVYVRMNSTILTLYLLEKKSRLKKMKDSNRST